VIFYKKNSSGFNFDLTKNEGTLGNETLQLEKSLKPCVYCLVSKVYFCFQ